MANKHLNKLGGTLRYWKHKNGVLCFGYNQNGEEVFFIRKDGKDYILPHILEYINSVWADNQDQDYNQSIKQAWENLKNFCCEDNRIMTDAYSDKHINSL